MFLAEQLIVISNRLQSPLAKKNAQETRVLKTRTLINITKSFQHFSQLENEYHITRSNAQWVRLRILKKNATDVSAAKSFIHLHFNISIIHISRKIHFLLKPSTHSSPDAFSLPSTPTIFDQMLEFLFSFFFLAQVGVFFCSRRTAGGRVRNER